MNAIFCTRYDIDETSRGHTGGGVGYGRAVEVEDDSLVLDIKPKLHDVAVSHNVILTLETGFAGGSSGGERASVHQVSIADDLSFNEAFLKIGVNDTGKTGAVSPW